MKNSWTDETGGMGVSVISVINLKGGVAKTTTSVNMAYLLSRCGYRVLLVDNDKQGNASKLFDMYDPDDKVTAAALLLYEDLNMNEIIKATEYERLDMITANMQLLSANTKVLMDPTRPQQTRFREALAPAMDCYDYIIIDNAPDINVSIINALTISDDVVVPVVVDQWSMDGMDILVQQMDTIRMHFNPGMHPAKCLVTNYHNDQANQQGEQFLKTRYQTFQTHIRHSDSKVQESTFAKIPVVKYSPRCGAAVDYRSFVREYLERRAKGAV